MRFQPFNLTIDSYEKQRLIKLCALFAVEFKGLILPIYDEIEDEEGNITELDFAIGDDGRQSLKKFLEKYGEKLSKPKDKFRRCILKIDDEDSFNALELLGAAFSEMTNDEKIQKIFIQISHQCAEWKLEENIEI